MDEQEPIGGPGQVHLVSTHWSRLEHELPYYSVRNPFVKVSLEWPIRLQMHAFVFVRRYVTRAAERES